MSAQLTALQSAVSGLQSSVDAAIVAINAPHDDPAALEPLTATLNAQKAALDAALNATTPT